MFRREDYNVTFLVEIMHGKSVARAVQHVHHGQVELSILQLVLQLGNSRLTDRDFNTQKILLKLGQKARQPHRTDGRHDTQPDWNLVQQPKIVGQCSCRCRLLHDVVEMRQQ